MSVQLQKRFEKVIEKLGAVKFEKPVTGFTHQYETRIGPLYLKVDTEGSVLSLFGNFIECADCARREFGHWKYNLHQFKTEKETFEESIKNHLEKTL